MRYSELVDSGATTSEKQEHLVGGGMTTTTIRIPRNLKDAGAEMAARKGISFSAYLRMCMLRDLLEDK
ncbi:hypothetical protein HF843_07450 [Bifidobacterium boum]|uniref:Uncharacterized protein n=1 Tax=Bifidobacterium boum TaxID=78343 RepID=A0A848D563_9BIFI|nr:hypothetical protein [Bifidobacterium boum]NMF02996.1 hypothetical protein [Bifidobacterium boum]